MPMWDSCRASDAACSKRRAATWAGFTLLELLVVLAIVGIMVALVAPRLVGTVDAIQVSGDRAEVARQIADLPVMARLSGAGVRLSKDADLAGFMVLPKGWSAHLLAPLDVSALGVCGASVVRVAGPRGVEDWQIRAPDCGIQQ